MYSTFQKESGRQGTGKIGDQKDTNQSDAEGNKTTTARELLHKGNKNRGRVQIHWRMRHR